MQIYNYDRVTKEYIGETLAEKDPEKSLKLDKFVPLIPACATLEKPLEAKEGYAVVFNNGWEYVADNRQRYAINADLDYKKIDYLGELEEGYVLATEKQIEIISEKPNFYLFENGKLVENPNYLKEEAEKEAERIARLFLTGADVERGIYQAKGIDFDDILEFVKANPPEGLDIKALKIELKANNFYRGNPYVDAIGSLLGFTKGQLDKFFEDGNYEHLLT